MTREEKALEILNNRYDLYGDGDDAIELAIQVIEERMHKCSDCKNAGWWKKDCIYCEEHEIVMRSDNYCRDWSNEQ